MKYALSVIVAFAIITVAVALTKDGNARESLLRAEGRLEVAQQRLDSAEAESSRLRARDAELSARYARDSVKWLAERDSIAEVVELEEATHTDLAQRVRAAVTDSVRVMVDSLIFSRETVVAALKDDIAILEADRTELRGLIVSRDHRIVALENELRAVYMVDAEKDAINDALRRRVSALTRQRSVVSLIGVVAVGMLALR